MAKPEPTESRSKLEVFLGLFADVRGGEGSTTLLLTLNVFMLLLAYYIVKPVREALILAGGGAEVKSYAAAGQAILLLGAVPLYGMLAARFPRRRLINIVTLFFTACLVAFYLLAQFKAPLGVVFYLWVGIFNLMIIAQFWSFANDLYTPAAGKRLFAIVAFGASAGAVFGSFIAGRLIKPLGVYQLLLVTGGLLALSLLITNWVDRRARNAVQQPTEDQAQPEEEPIGKGQAFRLVMRSHYLLLIALLMLFLNWVNTTGEYILGRTVQNAAKEEVATPEVQDQRDSAYIEAAEEDTTGELVEEEFKADWEKNYTLGFIGKFYADFFSVVNLLGLLIQLFLVSRILKYFGVRIALLCLPLIAFGGYAILAFYPILTAVRWAKTAENSVDYSLQNTVRQVLFLPTTREEKYQAKQAIDTFFVRAGDVLSAVLVYAGTTWLAFQTKHFALVNLALVCVWIVLAFLIGRENRKLTSAR